MHSRRPNLLLRPGSGMRLSLNRTPPAAVNELIAEGDWDALRPMMSGPHLRSCLWRTFVSWCPTCLGRTLWSQVLACPASLSHRGAAAGTALACSGVTQTRMLPAGLRLCSARTCTGPTSPFRLHLLPFLSLPPASGALPLPSPCPCCLPTPSFLPLLQPRCTRH